MQPFNLWKLHSDYAVVHAALIIAGASPDEAESNPEYELGRKIPGYSAAKSAIVRAINTDEIKPSRIIYSENGDFNRSDIDLHETLISVSDLDKFTRSKGLICDFFDRGPQTSNPQYDSASPFFAKKLDAANKAWAAVTSDPSLLNGRSPKQALERWLRANAVELGLVNAKSQPVKNAIDEICKVANWKPEGGATPTRSPTPGPTPTPTVSASALAKTKPVDSSPFDLDDDIPF